MNQPPVSSFGRDPGSALRRDRLARRPYVVAALIVIAGLAVALLGITGPRPSPQPSIPEVTTAAPANSGEPDTAPSAGASPSIGQDWAQTNATPNPAYIEGLINLYVDGADVRSVGLGSSVVPVAAYQKNLLYSSGAVLYLVNPAKSERARKVATSGRCGRVTQAAMNAGMAIYVEVAPAGSSQGNSAVCPNWGALVDWKITIVDLASSETHQAAAGTIASNDASWSQPAVLCVALADHEYAFSRPDAFADTAPVEVHDLLDDRLIFRSDRLGGLRQLQLADSRLVVVASVDPEGGPLGRQAVLETEAWSSPLRTVGYTTGAVSLSRDGDRLAFASCDATVGCQTITLVGGLDPQVLSLPLGAGSVAVDTGNLGTVAWATQRSPEDPTSYVGVRNARWPESVALVGIAPPTWIYVQSDVLLMVSVAAGGIVQLYEVDLGSAHVHA